MDEINKMETRLRSDVTRDVKDVVSRSIDQFIKDEINQVNDSMIHKIQVLENNQHFFGKGMEDKLVGVDASIQELLSNTSNAIAKSNSILAKVIKDINITLTNLQETSEFNNTQMQTNIASLNESTHMAINEMELKIQSFADVSTSASNQVAAFNETISLALEHGLQSNKDKLINETTNLLLVMNNSWTESLMSLNDSVVVASHSLREEFNQSFAAQMAEVASDLSSLNSSLTQSILALSVNSTKLIESVEEKAKNDMLSLRQDIGAAINDSSSKAIALSLETTVSSFQSLNNSFQEARAEWSVERAAINNRINFTANAAVDASLLLNEKMDLMEDSLRGEASAALSAISKSLSLVTANLTQLLTEGIDQSKAEFLAMSSQLQERVTNLSNSIDVHTAFIESHMQSFSTSLNNTLETHRKEMDEANVTFSRLSGELESRVSADIQKSHTLSVEREAAMKASTEAKLAGHAEAVEVHIALVEEAMARRVRALEDRVTALVSDVRSLSHTLTHTALNLFANATTLLMTHTHTPSPPPPPSSSSSSSSVCECVSEERVMQIIKEMLGKRED